MWVTLTAGASGSAGLQLKPEAEGAQGAAGFDAAGAVNLDLARIRAEQLEINTLFWEVSQVGFRKLKSHKFFSSAKCWHFGKFCNFFIMNTLVSHVFAKWLLKILHNFAWFCKYSFVTFHICFIIGSFTTFTRFCKFFQFKFQQGFTRFHNSGFARYHKWKRNGLSQGFAMANILYQDYLFDKALVWCYVTIILNVLIIIWGIVVYIRTCNVKYDIFYITSKKGKFETST